MTSTVCVGLLFVFFCKQPEQIPADTFCRIYTPIKVSRNDNPKTIRSVIRMNLKWKRLCHEKSGRARPR